MSGEMDGGTRAESAPTLRFGFVTAVDGAGCRARVQFPDLDGLESYWLHVLQARTHRDKHYCLPDVGEHVACLLDGEGDEGVVLGAVFGDRDPAQGGGSDLFEIRFGNGDVLRHDRASGAWVVQCAGPVTVEAGGAVMVRAPSVTLDTPQTTCTGMLTVDGLLTYKGGMAGSGGGGAAASIQGNVQVDGSISASGSVMDGGGNSNHHSH